MVKVTYLPCRVRLRDGREGVLTVQGKPSEDFPYSWGGFSHPGRSMEFTELWMATGHYHADWEESRADIVEIL